MYVVEVFSIKNRNWRIILTTSQKDRAEETWHRLTNNGMSPRMRKVTA